MFVFPKPLDIYDRIRPRIKATVTYFNKSYSGDLQNSVTLYRSFERYYRGPSRYIICVAADEVALFKTEFVEFGPALESGRLAFVSEEHVLTSARIDPSSFASEGWRRQQVIKLAFAHMCPTDTYVTLDSDNEIIRTFDDRQFFHRGQIKTSCKNIPVEAVGDDFIKQTFGTNYERLNFVDGYGLWDKAIVLEMEKYLKNHGLSFVDAISRAAMEQQWYGAYVLSHQKAKFHPTKDHFLLVRGCSMDDPTRHLPDSDIRREIAMNMPWRLRSPIGINIHYPAGHRGKSVSALYRDA